MMFPYLVIKCILVSFQGENTQEAVDKVLVLRKEMEELDDIENDIDQHKRWISQSIKNISEDSSNAVLAYVTHQDICESFAGETLLAVQAPNGTQLEVPIPNEDGSNYQIHLKSAEGQIYVLLVNKDEDEDPVVVQVPPPKEVIDQLDNDERPKKRLRSPQTNPQAAKKCKLDGEVAEIMSPGTNIPGLEEFISTEMFGPLMRLSPPPSDKDYCFNLGVNEGVCELFDV